MGGSPAVLSEMPSIVVGVAVGLVVYVRWGVLLGCPCTWPPGSDSVADASVIAAYSGMARVRHIGRDRNYGSRRIEAKASMKNWAPRPTMIRPAAHTPVASIAHGPSLAGLAAGVSKYAGPRTRA